MNKCKKIKCSRCCEFIRVELTNKWDEDYCKARGLKSIEGYFPTIEIPSRCPQLKDGECKLGDKRPKICKRFRCNKMSQNAKRSV